MPTCSRWSVPGEEEGKEVLYQQSTEAGLYDCLTGRQRYLSRVTDVSLQVIIYLKMRVTGSAWRGVEEVDKVKKKIKTDLTG